MNAGACLAFLSMGGYAPYVWGSFGACALAFAAEAALLRLRRHAALRAVRRQAQADALEEGG